MFLPSHMIGTLLGLLAFGLYAVSDVALKWLGAGLHPMQILFFSCLFALPLILAYAIASDPHQALRPRHPRLTLLRAVITVANSFLVIHAFGALPLAHAAIDISDGLVGDIGHILAASGVGATLDVDAMPAGPVLATQAPELRRRFCVAGGDDYELCFTAPRSHRDAIGAAAAQAGTTVTRVGRIDAQPGLRLVDGAGVPLALQLAGFDHFSNS